jgi:hypothetical protein
MKSRLGPAVLSLGLLGVIACGSTSSTGSNPDGPGTDPTGTPTTTATPPGTPPGTPPPGDDGGVVSTGKLKTVFVIMMENHSWPTVKNSASSTYINSLLATGAHAEAYSTPPGNHPSEPNYIWLEAGDNLGIKNDDTPAANHQSTTDHLVTQLTAAGVSWKAYAEGITNAKCPLSAISSQSYDPKHTPQLYFDDVTDTNSLTSATCISHVRPFTELATDIAANKVAQYNFITPNLCNDMHGDGYNTKPCGFFASDDSHIKLGDDWLKANIPVIQGSSAYKAGGAIFIIWDEGDEPLAQTAADGPIGMIVLSPKAKPGFSSPTPFTHSSTLRTIETIFGVPYLRGAQSSNDLSEMFTSFP